MELYSAVAAIVSSGEALPHARIPDSIDKQNTAAVIRKQSCVLVNSIFFFLLFIISRYLFINPLWHSPHLLAQSVHVHNSLP